MAVWRAFGISGLGLHIKHKRTVLPVFGKVGMVGG